MAKTRDHVKALWRYARGVASGKIAAGKHARLACQRHLDDFEKSKSKAYPYEFDPLAAGRICRFAELLSHVKGKWAARGERIKLEDWQCFFLGAVFGWMRRTTKKRRFREVYLEVPRKSGKSLCGAIIGNYCLLADGEVGAEIFSGATSEKQAWEVFRPARLMLQRSPALVERYGVEIWAKSILKRSDLSRFEPVIGKPGDGASPSCAIIDEFHEHQTPDLCDTMATGMVAREQPLLVMLTTAGSDVAGPCYEKHGEVKKMLDGIVPNEELFGMIYGIDEDADDWTDPKALAKANPNFGVSADAEILLSRQRQAVLNTAQQARFKTRHLNIWTQARSGLFNLHQWRLAGDAGLAREEFHGAECWFALDLAQKSDMAAFVELYKRDLDGATHWYVFGRYYLPEAAVEEPGPNHAVYRKWVIDGRLVATDGATVDYEAIKADVIAAAKRANPAEVVYDPYNATHLAQRLMDEGLKLVEYPQTPPAMAVPCDELVSALKDARLHHDGDPVLAWMAANCVGRFTRKGLLVPMKEKPHQKIDGVVALIMALGRGSVGEDRGSVYDERGVIAL